MFDFEEVLEIQQIILNETGGLSCSLI